MPNLKIPVTHCPAPVDIVSGVWFVESMDGEAVVAEAPKRVLGREALTNWEAMVRSFSSVDLSRVLNLATRCLSVGTREDISNIISGLHDVVPFKKAVLCKLSPAGRSKSVEEFINHSYGVEWANVYVSGKLEQVDPILRCCEGVSGAFIWKDAAAPVVDRASTQFLEIARDFGILDGVSFSCTSPTDLKHQTLVSICGIAPKDIHRALASLTIFGPHLHEAYRRITADQGAEVGSVELTAREVEVLNWMQQGKTYWEIGCILGISERTVKFHFTSVKRKLQVVSAPHAVAKALRLGLIR